MLRTVCPLGSEGAVIMQLDSVRSAHNTHIQMDKHRQTLNTCSYTQACVCTHKTLREGKMEADRGGAHLHLNTHIQSHIHKHTTLNFMKIWQIPSMMKEHIIIRT